MTMEGLWWRPPNLQFEWYFYLQVLNTLKLFIINKIKKTLGGDYDYDGKTIVNVHSNIKVEIPINKKDLISSTVQLINKNFKKN
jgi:hypothetical protein